MPPRLQDNIDSKYAVWTAWENLTQSVGNLITLIDEASARPKSRIDNSRQRRIRNG